MSRRLHADGDSGLLLVFVLINILLLVLGILVLRAPLHNLNSLRTTLRLQENRLTLKNKLLDEKTANLDLLASLNEKQSRDIGFVIPYEHLADALAAVSQLSRACGLVETSFYTGEIITHETEENDPYRIVEVKVSISCEGTYENACSFLHALAEAETFYRIERFSLETDDAGLTYLRVNFAVYSEE